MLTHQHQPYCQNGCHLAKYIVSNILMKAHGRNLIKSEKSIYEKVKQPLSAMTETSRETIKPALLLRPTIA